MYTKNHCCCLCKFDFGNDLLPKKTKLSQHVCHMSNKMYFNWYENLIKENRNINTSTYHVI